MKKQLFMTLALSIGFIGTVTPMKRRNAQSKGKQAAQVEPAGRYSPQAFQQLIERRDYIALDQLFREYVSNAELRNERDFFAVYNQIGKLLVNPPRIDGKHLYLLLSLAESYNIYIDRALQVTPRNGARRNELLSNSITLYQNCLRVLSNIPETLIPDLQEYKNMQHMKLTQRLYEKGDMQDCINYGSAVLSSFDEDDSSSERTNLHFIVGAARFSLEQYENAMMHLLKAYEGLPTDFDVAIQAMVHSVKAPEKVKKVNRGIAQYIGVPLERWTWVQAQTSRDLSRADVSRRIVRAGLRDAERIEKMRLCLALTKAP